jgi:hypothetical protein
MGVYVVMGADVRDTVQSGNPNWLLDMTPGSRGQTPKAPPAPELGRA